jgi:hypothetical protein
MPLPQAVNVVRWNAPELRDYESGRVIYDETGITGLNRIPIGELAGNILAGAKFNHAESLPVAPEELVNTLLIDGCWLDAQGVIQANIISASQNQAVQYIPPANPGEDTITRIWERVDDGWNITDYKDYGQQGQAATREPGFAPDALVRWYYNPLCPTGVLYPARKTYARLEELADSMRNAQRGPGAKTGIPGYVHNRNLVAQDLLSDRPFFFTGTETPLDRMTSTAVVDQLLTEIARLEPKYYAQTHIVDTSNPVQRPSGADRQLVLGPMFRFVDAMRKQVSAVLALYNATWVYERIHTTDTAERIQQLDLLVRQRDLMAITAQDFVVQAGEL